ncbi:MAG TPA: phenylacetic acid degradation protein PaaN [Mycobacteriales bacterium]|nr:phenylacetic acid degradation protein PaaN [Mycobacteriales bacterium]
MSTVISQFTERHRATLDSALAAIVSRGFWTPYPESARAYGEDADAAGRAAFEKYLNAPFPLEQPGTDGRAGDERSPYGFDLGVRYPHADTDALLAAMGAAMPAWRDAGPDVRAAVCLEILHRLNQRSAEIGHAVMHTTGQAPGMAFQAGGPHAQDRGLEAVAYAHAEMTRHPAEATWVKPQGRRPPLRMVKRYTAVPRGVALVVGCNTFPTWNGYPGLFASLVTGNPVVVKPHPRAVLPLAITVAVAREVLAEAGFSPDLVTLAAEAPGEGLAKTLALRPEVRLIDYTGSTAFGEWLEDNARQAQVYAEKAGVNTVVIDSTDDYQGMLANLAFSLSLYSGQMCTTPQNLLVPREGIHTDAGHRSVAEFGADLAGAIDGLLSDVRRATGILGAIVNDGVADRLEAARGLGATVLDSRAVEHPQYPDAMVRTPLLVRLDADGDGASYAAECFGPVTFLVVTADTAASLDLLVRTTRERGALTASVYSTDASVLAAAESAALDGGVALSCNLTGGVYVNQSAAFSDYHATGANPAANATLSDGAFVSGRFRFVQSRHHIPAEAAADAS